MRNELIWRKQRDELVPDAQTHNVLWDHVQGMASAAQAASTTLADLVAQAVRVASAAWDGAGASAGQWEMASATRAAHQARRADGSAAQCGAKGSWQWQSRRRLVGSGSTSQTKTVYSASSSGCGCQRPKSWEEDDRFMDPQTVT
ncbi:hypothetical protein ACP70R_048237 [Stipagrostis hirtigluma subsp. patula]